MIQDQRRNAHRAKHKSTTCRPRRNRRGLFETLEQRRLLTATLTGQVQLTMPRNYYALPAGKPAPAMPVMDAKVTLDEYYGDPRFPIYSSSVYTHGPGQLAGKFGFNNLPTDTPKNVPGVTAGVTIDYTKVSFQIYVTASSNTDAYGQSFSVQIATASFLNGNLNLQVPLGPTPYAKTPVETLNNLAGGAMTHNVTITVPPNPGDSGTDQAKSEYANALLLAQRFYIFDAMVYGRQYYDTLIQSDGSAHGGALPIYVVSAPQVPGGAYSKATPEVGQSAQLIMVDVYTGNGTADDPGVMRPQDLWDAVLHEYGHYVADLNGFYTTPPQSASEGSHYYDYNIRNGNAETTANRTLAWNEGFADYFSVIAQQGAVRGFAGQYNLAGVGDTSFELDNLSTQLMTAPPPDVKTDPGFTFAGGEDSESSVAHILFQLQSLGATYNSVDRFFNATDLFTVLMTDKPLTLYDFYNDAFLPSKLGKLDPNDINADSNVWANLGNNWANLFEQSAVTPFQLGVKFDASQVPTFTFDIPQTRVATNDGPGKASAAWATTPDSGAAFNDFEIVIANASGTVVDSISYIEDSANFTESQVTDTSKYLGQSNVKVTQASFTLEDWQAIAEELDPGAAPGTQVTFDWTVKAAYGTTNDTVEYSPAFSPPSQSATFRVPAPVPQASLFLAPTVGLDGGGGLTFVNGNPNLGYTTSNGSANVGVSLSNAAGNVSSVSYYSAPVNTVYTPGGSYTYIGNSVNPTDGFSVELSTADFAQPAEEIFAVETSGTASTFLGSATLVSNNFGTDLVSFGLEQPSITSLTTSSLLFAPGDPTISLQATVPTGGGVNGANAIASVSFYADTSGQGNIAADILIGTGPVAGGTASVPLYTTADQTYLNGSDPAFIIAVATDVYNQTSQLATIELDPTVIQGAGAGLGLDEPHQSPTSLLDISSSARGAARLHLAA